MPEDAEGKGELRYGRIVTVAGLAGAFALVAFRVLIELGFAPDGSLRVGRVPLEYVCLVWFLALLAVRSDERSVSGAARLRGTAYVRWLGIVGVAGSMWLVRDLMASRLIRSAAPAYWCACACAVAVFLSSSSVRRAHTVDLVRRGVPDAVRILGRPITWTCAMGAVAILAVAPRSLETPAGGRAFLRWYSRQPRVSVPASWQLRAVTLVELTDYQCPVCRTAASRFGSVIRGAAAKYGDAFAFVRVDFPLDNECNPIGQPGRGAGLHPAACEAAAAVRLAKTEGLTREGQVVEWLWTHQNILTREVVFNGVQEQFGIDVRARYAQALAAVARDAELGRRLQVSGTPTFFLNGRRLPLVQAEALEAAIVLEMDLAVHRRNGAH
jgi:hypothetical protein